MSWHLTYIQQEKCVKIVAVGIGSDVDHDSLQLIAREGRQVFIGQKLAGLTGIIEVINSFAFSGELE